MEKQQSIYWQLRLATSALSVAACVLIAGLWARSYRRLDEVRIPLPRAYWLSIESVRGRLVWHTFAAPHLQRANLESTTAESDWARLDAELPPWRWIAAVPYGEAFVMPFWFPTIVTGSLAAAPWLKWRFRLGTMLIATTLLATILGLLVITS